MTRNSALRPRSQKIECLKKTKGRVSGPVSVPSGTSRNLERAMRFELTTLTLARLCSTPELRPRSDFVPPL